MFKRKIENEVLISIFRKLLADLNDHYFLDSLNFSCKMSFHYVDRCLRAVCEFRVPKAKTW